MIYLSIPVGIFLWEVRVAFPKESQLQQRRYPTLITCTYQVHAGSCRVSIIYRTLTWTTGSLTCVRDHFCACVFTRGFIVVRLPSMVKQVTKRHVLERQTQRKSSWRKGKKKWTLAITVPNRQIDRQIIVSLRPVNHEGYIRVTFVVDWALRINYFI